MDLDQGKHIWLTPGTKISWDIETDVPKTSDMMKGEPLLSITVAYRDMTNKLVCKSFIKKEETELAEVEIMKEFGILLRSIGYKYVRIGYFAMTYDHPVVAYRLKKFEDYFKNGEKLSQQYWKIKDFLNAPSIEASTIASIFMKSYNNGLYKPWSLSDLITHSAFSGLPLKTGKEHIPNNPDKGKLIKKLWKENPEAFREYCEADAVNTFLITEKMLVNE
ncbi:hypothetical protein HYX00_02625 [Candidatus Woesearchaeota archaeon]|nr:hypothetical protein [Candidatus Woesearchaeota archaeon]